MKIDPSPEMNLPSWQEEPQLPQPMTMDAYLEFVLWCSQNIPIDRESVRNMKKQEKPIPPFHIHKSSL